MWKCSKCGEQTEDDDFEICWNCSIGKDGKSYKIIENTDCQSKNNKITYPKYLFVLFMSGIGDVLIMLMLIILYTYGGQTPYGLLFIGPFYLLTGFILGIIIARWKFKKRLIKN